MRRSRSGLIITAIVLAGLVAMSAFGNLSFFGVIKVPHIRWDALGPGLLVALATGVAGGLFARLLMENSSGVLVLHRRLRGAGSGWGRLACIPSRYATVLAVQGPARASLARRSPAALLSAALAAQPDRGKVARTTS
jgi:hypothetical protein